MDQPLFEYQLWQVFLAEYVAYKIQKDKEDSQRTKAGMGPGRMR